MDKVFAELETKMKKTTEVFQKELSNIRTGRASAAVLDGVRVMYYGNPMPINQVAAISVVEAKTLDIKPWDKGVVKDLEKAIMEANLGLSIVNTGDSLKVRFPDLTEETRKDLVKKVKKMSEESKVDLRNIRRDFNEKVKDQEKNKEISQDELKLAETHIQKATDKHILNIDNIVKDKEKELMTI